MDIKQIWNSKEQNVWESALQNYSAAVKRNAIQTEEKLNSMITDDFRKMSGQDFYRFLVHDYALWKYTDCRIRSRVQHSIEEFHQAYTDYEFKRVLDGIFSISPQDIYLHLANITRITGLGVAGSSSVLALVLPQYFGTVDRFAVQNLQKVYDVNSYYGKKLQKTDPQNISAYDAVTIIRIYCEKAEELSRIFGISWTPRMIDMVLWSNS